MSHGYDLCDCGARKLRRSPVCRPCRLSFQPRMRPIAERLWEKVDRSAGPDACWPFMGAKMHNGYGHLGAGGRNDGQVAAHRVAYQDQVGPIPEGLNVLHRCDNRPCCNPRHLWIGTQRENLLDMIAKGRHPMMVKARLRREQLSDLQSSASASTVGAPRHLGGGAALVAREDDPAVLPAR